MTCESSQFLAGKTPTEILKKEHRVIETVLDAMECLVSSGRIDKAFMTDALDFFRNFADGCHHAKEENQLFPALEAAGIPREGGPIGCMLREHDQGRHLLGLIDANLDAASDHDEKAVQMVLQSAIEYIELLRQHIYKEDNILFTLADSCIDGEQQEQLLAAFDAVDQAERDEGKQDHYQSLADDLCRRAAADVPLSN